MDAAVRDGLPGQVPAIVQESSVAIDLGSSPRQDRVIQVEREPSSAAFNSESLPFSPMYRQL